MGLPFFVEYNGGRMKDEAVLQEVSADKRQSWIAVMFIWIGSMICLPSILVGSSIVGGLPFVEAIVAGIVGYIFILVITILQGIQSTDLGKPTVVVSEGTYGQAGSRYIFSFIIAISLVGWFGVQAEIAGGTVSQMLSSAFGISMSVPMASFIVGILMLITAIYGFKVMEYMNYVSVPLMIIVLLVSFVNAIHDTSITELVSYAPASDMSFIEGIGIAVGGFIVGAVIAGDYTRFNKNRKETVKSAAFGIVPAGILLIIMGAVLFILSGSDDLTTVLLQYFPIASVVFIMLLLATWTTNVTNAYSAGLAIVNGLGLKDNTRAKATAISGLIGTLLAVFGILDHFEQFLIILTALVTPISGVMIADYWIINHGSKKLYENKQPHHTLAIWAWVIGCLPALVVTPPFSTMLPEFITQNSVVIGLSSFSGILIAMVIYLVGVKLNKEEVTIESKEMYGAN